MDHLAQLLEESARLHRHLCPRQVLGVRMGLLAGRALGLKVPQPHKSKRLLTIVETDGCGADGISVATNCWLGKRTLQIKDFGKVAAAFVDTRTGVAIRIAPAPDIRQRAWDFATDPVNKWEAMLQGYQWMPDEFLFRILPVTLTTPLAKFVSSPGMRKNCQHCQEEIINEREVLLAGQVFCRACAGESYYQPQNVKWPDPLKKVTNVTLQ